MPNSKTTSVSPSAAKERPSRPFTAYNIFFQIERERILQENNVDGVAAKPSSTSTLDIDTDDISQRPPAYRHLILQKNWHVVDPERKKRLGTKKNRPAPHGILTFVELSKTIAASWRIIDAETKRYCHEIASKELVRYRKDMEAFVQKHGQDAAKKTYKSRKTNKKVKPADAESKEQIPVVLGDPLPYTVVGNEVAVNDSDFPDIFHPFEPNGINGNSLNMERHSLDQLFPTPPHEDDGIRPINTGDFFNAVAAFCLPAVSISVEQPDAKVAIGNSTVGNLCGGGNPFQQQRRVKNDMAKDHGMPLCLEISAAQNHPGSASNSLQSRNQYWADGPPVRSFARSTSNKQGNDAPGMNNIENKFYSNLPRDEHGLSMSDYHNMASFLDPEATFPLSNAPTSMREACYESLFNTNSMTSTYHRPSTKMPQQRTRMDYNQAYAEASSFSGGRRSSQPEAYSFPSFDLRPRQDHFMGDYAMGQSQSGNNEKSSKRYSFPDNYCFADV